MPRFDTGLRDRIERAIIEKEKRKVKLLQLLREAVPPGLNITYRLDERVEYIYVVPERFKEAIAAILQRATEGISERARIYKEIASFYYDDMGEGKLSIEIYIKNEIDELRLKEILKDPLIQTIVMAHEGKFEVDRDKNSMSFTIVLPHSQNLVEASSPVKSDGMSDEEVKYYIDELNSLMPQEKQSIFTSLGIKKIDLAKAVVNHPQLAGYDIKRVLNNLARELEVDRAKAARTVVSHPPLAGLDIKRVLNNLARELEVDRAKAAKAVVRFPPLAGLDINQVLSELARELRVDRAMAAKAVVRFPPLAGYDVVHNLKIKMELIRNSGVDSEMEFQVLINMASLNVVILKAIVEEFKSSGSEGIDIKSVSKVYRQLNKAIKEQEGKAAVKILKEDKKNMEGILVPVIRRLVASASSPVDKKIEDWSDGDVVFIKKKKEEGVIFGFPTRDGRPAIIVRVRSTREYIEYWLEDAELALKWVRTKKEQTELYKIKKASATKQTVEAEHPAASDLGVELSVTKLKGRYPDEPSVQRQLTIRKVLGLDSNPTALIKKFRTEGGDQSLYHTARRLGIELPKPHTAKIQRGVITDTPDQAINDIVSIDKVRSSDIFRSEMSISGILRLYLEEQHTGTNAMLEYLNNNIQGNNRIVIINADIENLTLPGVLYFAQHIADPQKAEIWHARSEKRNIHVLLVFSKAGFYKYEQGGKGYPLMEVKHILDYFPHSEEEFAQKMSEIDEELKTTGGSLHSYVKLASSSPVEGQKDVATLAVNEKLLNQANQSIMDWLEENVGQDEKPTPKQLADLARYLGEDQSPLMEALADDFRDPKTYPDRVRPWIKMTKSKKRNEPTVYLLFWPKGARTIIHNHLDANGNKIPAAIYVFRGSIKQIRYYQDIDPQTREHRQGEIYNLLEDDVHVLFNGNDTDEVMATIHVYGGEGLEYTGKYKVSGGKLKRAGVIPDLLSGVIGASSTEFAIDEAGDRVKLAPASSPVEVFHPIKTGRADIASIVALTIIEEFDIPGYQQTHVEYFIGNYVREKLYRLEQLRSDTDIKRRIEDFVGNNRKAEEILARADVLAVERLQENIFIKLSGDFALGVSAQKFVRDMLESTIMDGRISNRMYKRSHYSLKNDREAIIDAINNEVREHLSPFLSTTDPAKSASSPVAKPSDQLEISRIKLSILAGFQKQVPIILGTELSPLDGNAIDGIKHDIRNNGLTLEQAIKRLRTRKKGKRSLAEESSSSPVNEEVGGIDLNPARLNLQIKRDGNGIPLPINLQPIESMQIDGFLPVIINITPVISLPLLSRAVNSGPMGDPNDDRTHPSPIAYLQEQYN